MSNSSAEPPRASGGRRGPLVRGVLGGQLRDAGAGRRAGGARSPVAS
ncbi:hypothetical protein [Streptomyces sp. KL116D]